MSPSIRRQRIVLAEKFPPALVTNTSSRELPEGASPDCYGLDLDAETYLAAGSIPSGSAYLQKTYSAVSDGSATADYTWMFNRLWRSSTRTLVFGAQYHSGFYYPEAAGEIEFNDSANAILKILPAGPGTLCALCSDGGYLVNGVDEAPWRWSLSPLLPHLNISDAAHATYLNGSVYFANATGLYKLSNRDNTTEEVSLPIRGSFTPDTLTVHEEQGYVIVGSSLVYDTVTQKWFKYSGSDFLWTSRKLRRPDGNPFTVYGVSFETEITGGADTSITVQYRFGNRDWSDSETLVIEDEDGGRSRLDWPLPFPDTATDFQVKITAMPAAVKIRRVTVDASDFEYHSNKS